MSTHTKGPWKTTWNGIHRIQSAGGWLIAKIHHSARLTPKEVEANAKLIAAAPDLFTALQTLVQQSEKADSDGDWEHLNRQADWDAARAAIDKAR